MPSKLPPYTAVVVGLAPEQFTYERLTDAFRAVRGGAALVAVHKGRYLQGSGGLVLGPGPFVAGTTPALAHPRTSPLVGLGAIDTTPSVSWQP